jgi:outer membrane protein assembly factor BamB
MSARHCPATVRALALSVAGIVLTAVAARAADPTWSYKSDADIVFQRLTSLGSLLVSTDSRLEALDPSNGNVLWTNAELKGLRECYYDELANSQLALIDAGSRVGGARRRIIALDLATGKPMWDSENLPFISSLGVMQAPQKGLLIFAGLNRQGGKTVLYGVDAESGQLRWQQDKLFTKPLQLKEVKGSDRNGKRSSLAGNQLPVYPTDDTAILYLNAEGVVKIDLNTGDKLWVAPTRAKLAPALSDGYAQMELGDGVVFVPFEKTLQAVDVVTGKLLWSKTPKFKSHVAQLALRSHGLVVRGVPGVKPDSKAKPDGKPFIDVLDPRTGVSMWRKPFKDLEAATTFDINGDQLFIAADGELFSVKLADGASKAIAKVKFKGNEVARRLEVMDGNYLLSSSQNLMMVSPTGEVKFHEYYAAPGQNGWIKVLSTVVVVAASAASVVSPYGEALAITGVGSKYTSFSNPELSRRFKASKSGGGFQVILTSTESDGRKGVGLVKLEKTTGRKMADVVLGDKTPVYQMDPIDNRLFFQRGDRQIDCFAF